MFSQFQKDEALRIYDEVGSVDQAIHILGYPTRRCLYGWIRERDGKSSPEIRRANRSKRNAAQAAINDLNLGSEHILSPQEVDKLQADLHRSKMVLDILQEIVRRKQMLPVFNLSPISQREKTAPEQNGAENEKRLLIRGGIVTGIFLACSVKPRGSSPFLFSPDSS